MRLLPGFAAWAVFATGSVAADAGIPFPVRVTCPTDGTILEFYSTTAFSTWGQRPDGKPYGSWAFPEPLPECPDGLVLYRRAFDPEDIERLRILVASPEYRALGLAGETSYYRAYWLMRRMDAPEPDQLAILGQAIWQTDGDPVLRRRYLEELVGEARTAPLASDLTGLALRSWTINALRELGRFGEAESMLRATSFTIGGDQETAREVRAWRRHYRRLARLISRRDSSIEPLEMIPRLERARRARAEDD